MPQHDLEFPSIAPRVAFYLKLAVLFLTERRREGKTAGETAGHDQIRMAFCGDPARQETFNKGLDILEESIVDAGRGRSEP